MHDDEIAAWARSCAEKADDLIKAAGYTADALETAVGVLLSSSDAWPCWVHAGDPSQAGRPPAQQLELVSALSHRLSFATMLHSSSVRCETDASHGPIGVTRSASQAPCVCRHWLAQEILCSAQTCSPHEQPLASLQQLVLETIVSELLHDAPPVDGRPSIFDNAAKRCSCCTECTVHAHS